ncbi:unnamed protein product, partial [Effrenium voratum]
MCYPDPHSLAGPNGGLPFRRPVKRSGCSGCSLCSRMPVRHGGTAGSGSESGCYGMATAPVPGSERDAEGAALRRCCKTLLKLSE